MRQCNQILHFSELPLLVWAFIRVPTLFIIFPAFFFHLFAFGFTTYFGLLPVSLSQFIVSLETLRSNCSLDVNSSHGISSLMTSCLPLLQEGEKHYEFSMGPGRCPECWGTSEIHSVSEWWYNIHSPGPHRSFLAQGHQPSVLDRGPFDYLSQATLKEEGSQ